MNFCQLLMDLWVEILLKVCNKALEGETNGKDNLALVDYGVQRVSHLVRDGRVDQAQEFSLSLRSVIKDLLRDVDEADHCFLLLTLKGLYQTLLDLEEFELWNVLVIDTFHAW